MGWNMMHKRVGVACWWLGTGIALLLFLSTFYWLFSSHPNATTYALICLACVPLITLLFWAVSYFVTTVFNQDRDI